MVGRVLPTAMCVRGVDVLCVLQFTLIIAAGCALHRRTSRVIHRIELYFGFERRRGQLPPAFTLIPRGGNCDCASGVGPFTGLHDAINKQRKRTVTQVTSKENDRDDRSIEDGHPRALTPRSDPLALRKELRAPCKMLGTGSIQTCRPGPLPCRSIRPVSHKTNEAHVVKGV